MNSFLQKLATPFYEKYYTKQLRAFFDWLSKNSFSSKILIQIHLPTLKYKCNAYKKISYTDEIPTFIICTPDTEKDVFNQYPDQNNNWIPLFVSPVFSVWENQSFYPSDNKPIRFGLSKEIKKKLLAQARTSIINYITGQEIQPPEPGIGQLSELVNIDVAIWMNGALRGSQILFNVPLLAGVSAAAKKSAHDERFKPIQSHEIDDMKIEITLLSDLLVPLSKLELEKNEIYVDKGYGARAEERSGWFVPAVFNCLKFTNLNNLISRLASEKMQLEADKKIQDIFIFTVDSFIEENANYSHLYGPVLWEKYESSEQEILKIMSTASLSFLATNQESDGNIAPIIDPLTKTTGQIDWARLAFVIWSLAYYGNSINDNFSLDIAKKAYNFIEKNMSNFDTLPDYTNCLASIYLTRAERLLFPKQSLKKFQHKIVPRLNQLQYEPILYSQYAHLLLENDSNNNQNRAEAKKCTEFILKDFEQKRISNYKLPLAAYPELIPLLRNFEQKHLSKADEILDWYMKQQLQTGDFPAYPSSTFSYVRGTAKIFEVLVTCTDFRKEAKTKTLEWLYAMQYNEKNTFFIEPKFREKIQGGFRHDYFNQEAWIDANGHLLVIAGTVFRDN